ncbi:MAG: hypothetical protein G01um101425_453 [Candidatus Peregrinibacteria bacterium Gr01-1014_25]|nr:MAG: hypothetical protein G01um101425_453 [Candidatus Peregrinibacteria bacterium Gr01-1014_25]
MSIVILLAGLAPSIVAGWLLLRAIEGGAPSLLRVEHWAMASLLGPACAMLLAFLANVTVGLPLSRLGFLSVHVVLLGLAVFAWNLRCRSSVSSVSLVSSSPPPRWVRITLWILAGWTTVKILTLASAFLFLTPTFLDDSLDNWNLRAKVFQHEQTFSLSLPGIAMEQQAIDVTSYPPMVPMLKAWLTTLGGEWSEPVANGVHLLWLLTSIALVACAVRRFLSAPWAWLGAYVLCSLPLFLIHGVNTYVDAFLAAHIAAAVLPAWLALRATDDAARGSLLRIAAVMTALLPFTKNEASVLYLPLIAVILIAELLARTGGRRTANALAWYAGAAAVLALPWLVYKWSHGLAFGNAKAVSDVALAWHEGVLQAVVVNTFFEGNWLILFPLFFVLLAWRARHLIRSPERFPILFVLASMAAQLCIFLFTPLAAEAVRQTGLARGLIHLTPIIVVLLLLFIHDTIRPWLPVWAKRSE